MKGVTYHNRVTFEEYRRMLTIFNIGDALEDASLFDRSVFIVAKIHDEMVGMAQLVMDNFTRGVLINVVVLEKYRHNGIGQNIMQKMIQTVYNSLRKDEFFLIELYSVKEAIHFYQKCGFLNDNFCNSMYLQIKK